MNILFKKVDSRTHESNPQGGATLKDAEFTVYYYDTTDLDTLKNSEDFKDHDTRVVAATRKCVYKTNEKGYIDKMMQKPVSGDDIYTDSNGDPTFPIGTYVIEETNPPKGYLIPDNCDDRCYIEVITSDGSSSEHVETFHKESYTFSPINDKTVTNSKGEK